MNKRLLAGMTIVLVLSIVLVSGASLAFASEKISSAEKVLKEAVGLKLQELGSNSGLDSITRKNLVDDIYEYTIILKVGAGQFDKIGLHRVVKEKKPWTPIKTDEAVMMVHGDANNFTSEFLSPSDNVPPDQSIGVFLAQKGIDVWGIDLRWTFVPDTTTNFSFMKKWDTALHLKDIKCAVSVARVLRGVTGSGLGRIFMLGHSRGGQFVYAYANAETQSPTFLRDLKGIIPVDMVYKYAPENEEQRQAALANYQVLKSLYDAGIYYSDEAAGLKYIAVLAGTAPDEPSPVVPGLTNRQAAISVLASTYATYEPPLQPPAPFYHYLAGTFDPYGIPTGLQFANLDYILDIALTVPSFQSLGEIIDGEAIFSDSVEVPYDDHLADIKIPVFYLGAAGGFGEYGLYTTELLGSTDISTLIVQLHPPEAAALDYGHADLFWADNAKDLVWEPIYNWLSDH